MFQINKKKPVKSLLGDYPKLCAMNERSKRKTKKKRKKIKTTSLSNINIIHGTRIERQNANSKEKQNEKRLK